jgi:hypothetical protein
MSPLAGAAKSAKISSPISRNGGGDMRPLADKDTEPDFDLRLTLRTALCSDEAYPLWRVCAAVKHFELRSGSWFCALDATLVSSLRRVTCFRPTVVYAFVHSSRKSSEFEDLRFISLQCFESCWIRPELT